MTPAVLLVLVGLAAGAWLLGHLRTAPPAACGEAPLASTVSVVVPARDEAATLPRLLGSIAALERPPGQVLVVDDGSTDGTATVARRGGATVLTAPPLPPGWLGKPWACRTGAAAATGEVLVFLDADCWLAPEGLERLLAAHAAQGDGLLSVQPSHITERPYEQLSAVCNVVSMMGSGAFEPGRRGEVPVAFGPCLVTSTAAYRQVGGHDVVAGEVVEDIALARAYRDAGLPVRCLIGGSAVAFRMYPGGLRQLVEGWTKNLARGARLAPPRATLGTAVWVAACSTVAAALVSASARAVGGGRPEAWVVVSWAAVAAQLWWVLRRIGSFRWWAAVAFPLPLAAFVALFLRSLLRRATGRRVTWRGRHVAARHRAG